MNKPNPLAIKILRSFCPPHLLEEIEGDLLQKFERDLKLPDHSEWSDDYKLQRAKRRLIWNVVRFCRPGIILRNKNNLAPTPVFMINNYFKVAARVMARNKTYSTINILGLTLGITSAILLFLWVEKEFSYDQFHADKDRLYVAWNRELQNGGINCWSTTPRILAPTLMAEYPSVESAISYATWGAKHLFTVGENRMVKSSGAFIDPQFLTMFSFPLIKGDPSKALSNPNSIVLTESFAKQLFGDKDAFGEILTIGESGYTFPFTVSGILKDLPNNTDFHFEYLISWQFLESLGEKDTHWENNSVATYIKLKRGEDIESFNKIVKGISQKHSPEENTVEIFFYPLTNMRLHSRFENGVAAGGRIEIIRMIAILGICLVTIACINFVNLSTARAQKRAKEVGIRKVTGAFRYSLIVQFLCESVLIALGAGILSVIIVYLVLPSFGLLIQQRLLFDFTNPIFWLAILSFIGLVGLLAGSYPAFYLSSFHPIRVLKGAPITANRNRLRHALVVLQFGFAVMLIVSVLVIGKQIEYVQNRETGYAKNNLIYHPFMGDLSKTFQAYKNELISSGAALSITKSSSPITERMSNTTDIEWNGKNPLDKTVIERFYVDENICRTAGLTILQGRDIEVHRFPTDSTAVLLNEAALKLMNFAQPIGEEIIDNGIKWHVVGVVKDFILTSPYQKVTPIVLLGSKKDMLYTVHIRLNPNRPVQQSLSAIAGIFTKYNPTYPFEYHFVDEEYQRKFANLQTTLTISRLFGAIAIFIACLGLLGLSTFMIESRIKEIGIRKVLGSSVINIVRLLSTDALKPIIVAVVFFNPLAWWSMNWWLQSFDYRISMDTWIFLGAAAIILAIALATVTVQTVGAARENPIKSLKVE